MLHHARDSSCQSVQGQLCLDAAQRDARRGGRSRRSAPGARVSVARAARAHRDPCHAPPSGPCRRHRRAARDALGSRLRPAQGTDPHAHAAGVRRRARRHPRAWRRFLGDRHPRAHARAHRLLWGRVAVLWRYAVRVRLRAPVRRHRRADVRVAAEAARAARRDEGVLRARVHAREHRLRQNRRAAQRSAQATRAARPAPARGGQADAAEHAGRGKGHQSVPALPRAGGGRVGQQVPRSTHCRSCESIRRNTGLEEPPLKNKRVLAWLLIALLQACASKPVPPGLPGEQASAAVAASSAPAAPPPAASPQPALPPASLPDASGLPPFDGEQQVIQDPLRGLRKIDRTEPPADLWQRIRQGFAIPDIDSALVDKHTAYYAARPEYLQRVFDRSRLYLYHIVEEIEKRGLPTELALLPMVESAFNPMAYSRAHASGLWQFIPRTGRRFELKQNWWYDGRRDIVDSTTAALDYLTKLYELHGDWQLALASYNWGENGIARSIARNLAAHKPTDYASLKMPAETRMYLPKLQALKNIISNPAPFGIVLDPIPNVPYFAAYTELRDIDVQLAAKLAEMPVEEFIALNPGFSRPLIRAAMTPRIVLPADKVDVFHANLIKHDENALVSWQSYQPKRGETFESIAKKFGLTLGQLKEVNGIAPRRREVPGLLVVPVDIAAASGMRKLPIMYAPPIPIVLRRIFHTVRRGETFDSIAERYGVIIEDIKRWNRVSRLATGQRIALEVRAPAKRGKLRSRPKGRRYRKAA